MDNASQSPCPTILEHLAESREYRDRQFESSREIFQRLNRIEQCNTQQTAMLETIGEKMDDLANKTDKTYTTYQIGKGFIWVACGIGSLILTLAALVDIFEKLNIHWGKP